MNKRQLITTADGSHSFYIADLDETYHSKHGAIQEAYHVFIKNGFDHVKVKSINILEIGLGTGLNCFITFLEGKKRNLNIHYTGIEAFPIPESEVKSLNYIEQLNALAFKDVFKTIHHSKWNVQEKLSDHFLLTKKKQIFQDIKTVNSYHLIYFDAFGPRVQPELWTENIFQKMYDALLPGGILVTYSAKGSVRRVMESLGFRVERLAGPPGKREMLRGKKLGQ